jgi:hypothetical protein
MAEDQYSPEETARRRDESFRRALNTPPKPSIAHVGKKKPPKLAAGNIVCELYVSVVLSIAAAQSSLIRF